MELCILMTLKQKNQKLMSVCNSVPQCWDRMCHNHWRDRLQEWRSTHCPEMWPTNWAQRLGSATIPISDIQVGPGTWKIKGQYGTPTNTQQRTSHARASRRVLSKLVTLYCSALLNHSPGIPPKPHKPMWGERMWDLFHSHQPASCWEGAWKHFTNRNERPFPLSLWTCLSAAVLCQPLAGRGWM